MSIQQSPSVSTIAAPPELSALLEAVKDELDLVEQFLNSNLVDDSPFIEELLAQVFKAGGKRLRPALSLLAGKATTANGTGELGRMHIILAVLTELIHTASLVHDDVIDNAPLRRGAETVNRKWNEKLAVLTGDLLFAQASVCLARLMNPPIVGIYGQVLGDLCAGEIRQMRQQFVLTIDWDAYIQKSIWKTASLFAAGTQSAAILNLCTDSEVSAMKQYGLNLGICFQIVDDLLDVTSTESKLGKPAGSDLSQGLITAPALFVLTKEDADGMRLKELIRTRQVSSPEGIEESLAIIKRAGGVEQTVSLANKYAQIAREALHSIAPSSYRDCLAQMIDWLLERTH